MNLSYKNLTELVNNFSKDEFDKISSNDQLITKLSKFCHENKLDISPNVKFVDRVGRPTKLERRQTDKLMGRD